eukprot:2944587-Prymnesium_polylepis.2
MGVGRHGPATQGAAAAAAAADACAVAFHHPERRAHGRLQTGGGERGGGKRASVGPAAGDGVARGRVRPFGSAGGDTVAPWHAAQG